MALYGVRLVINLFDLCIYRRYLEEFIGNRADWKCGEPDGDKLAEFCDDGCDSLCICLPV